MCRLAGQSCVSDCLNQVVLALAVVSGGITVEGEGYGSRAVLIQYCRACV